MTRVVKNPSGYRSSGRNAIEKAQQFGAYAKSHGWQGKYHLDEETRIMYLFARRDDETIEIWWSEGGKALPDRLPIYTLGTEKIKLRNVSAAAVRVAGEPDLARLSRKSRQRRKKLGEHTEPVVVKGSYDFSEHTDDDVEKTLLGTTITWVNSLSGELLTADVAGRKSIKVTSENCKRQIHFTDSRGFHAVYLDSIVSVA